MLKHKGKQNIPKIPKIRQVVMIKIKSKVDEKSLGLA
jgi:hypothetical protein